MSTMMKEQVNAANLQEKEEEMQDKRRPSQVTVDTAADYEEDEVELGIRAKKKALDNVNANYERRGVASLWSYCCRCFCQRRTRRLCCCLGFVVVFILVLAVFSVRSTGGFPLGFICGVGLGRSEITYNRQDQVLSGAILSLAVNGKVMALSQTSAATSANAVAGKGGDVSVVIQVYQLKGKSTSVDNNYYYDSEKNRFWEPMGQAMEFDYNGAHPVFTEDGTTMVRVTSSEQVEVMTYDEEQDEWEFELNLLLEGGTYWEPSTISLSNDATVLAVLGTDDQVPSGGSLYIGSTYVAVYEYKKGSIMEYNTTTTPNTWTPITIKGNFTHDTELIQAMELSKDGSTLALSVYDIPKNESRLRLYYTSRDTWYGAGGEEWTQADEDLLIDSGYLIDPQISLSYQGDFLAIAFSVGGLPMTVVGFEELHNYDTAPGGRNGTWVCRGEILDLESTNTTTHTRSSIDMSYNGESIIVGTVAVEGEDDFQGRVEYFQNEWRSFDKWLAPEEPLFYPDSTNTNEASKESDLSKVFGSYVALSRDITNTLVMVVGAGGDPATGTGEVYWYEGERHWRFW